MNDHLQDHALYIGRAFGDFKELVADARRDLKGVKFDTLVGIGLSGALVIPRLADVLNVKWMIVRKQGDGAHSTRAAEGYLGRKWLFVDDLIESGDTYETVVVTISNLATQKQWNTEHVGSWVYDQYGNSIYDDTLSALDCDAQERIAAITSK